MNSRLNQTDPRIPHQSHIPMESRATKNTSNIPQSYRHVRSFSETKKQVTTSSGYFSIESMLVLVGLTASLLILPLMLPTLPPPPLLLLVVPIGILALLMVIAFMPSNVRDLTYM